MQVNDIKITELDSVTYSSAFSRFLGRIGLLGIVASPIAPFIYPMNVFIPIAAFVSSLLCVVIGFIMKYDAEPGRDEGIIQVINRALESKRTATGGIIHTPADDDAIDKIITYLKINGYITKKSAPRIEKIVISALLGHKYNRIISRMYQHNLIKEGSGIFTVKKSNNYFKLAKELLNLGIEPAQVFFEDNSEFFALVVTDEDDAHFGALVKDSDADSEYEPQYISANELIAFTKLVRITSI